jgi:AraC-like DNA-binding protein
LPLAGPKNAVASVLGHQVPPPAGPGHLHLAVSHGVAPRELLAHARRTLEHDPQTARDCLDRLDALLAYPAEPAVESILLPWMPSGAHVRTTKKGGLAPWQIHRVSEHVEGFLANSILLDTLAQVVRLSTGHFCRAFKVSVGETPHAFVIRRRVRRAQSLMLSTNDPLSQIAVACGLTDQAHLTRLFRRMVGETPLAWRRSRAEVPRLVSA